MALLKLYSTLPKQNRPNATQLSNILVSLVNVNLRLLKKYLYHRGMSLSRSNKQWRGALGMDSSVNISIITCQKMLNPAFVSIISSIQKSIIWVKAIMILIKMKEKCHILIAPSKSHLLHMYILNELKKDIILPSAATIATMHDMI